MATTVLAVYQGGVLCPIRSLPLHDGETVEITFQEPRPATHLTEEEAVCRIREAKNLAELFVAANAAPEDENYDLLKALEENRKYSGDCLPRFAQDDLEQSP